MIGKSMEQWSDEQLQNVADAPPDKWKSRTIGRDSHCLVGHAVSTGRAFKQYGVSSYPERGELVGFQHDRFSVHHRFDDIAEKHGVDTARILCQNRARRILARRTLNAFTPLLAGVPNGVEAR